MSRGILANIINKFVPSEHLCLPIREVLMSMMLLKSTEVKRTKLLSLVVLSEDDDFPKVESPMGIILLEFQSRQNAEIGYLFFYSGLKGTDRFAIDIPEEINVNDQIIVRTNTKV